jgi:type I restriction enzyme S subunit
MSVRAPVGPVNFSTQTICIGRGLAAIRVSENLKKDFLFYYLINIQDKLSGSSGAVFNSINKTQIENLEIPIPPLPEQQRIVEILDQSFAAIDQAVENTEKNITKINHYFDICINEIFENPGPEYEENELSDLCSIKHGYSFESKEFETNYNGDKPIVLTPGNFLENGKLYFNERNTKRILGFAPKDYQFNDGDLVLVMTDLSSKMKLLGKPAFIEGRNILHNQRIGLVQLVNNKINKKFLYYYFQTNDYLSKIKETSTGTMVRHTAPKRILQNRIKIPPLNTQETITLKLDKLRIDTQIIISNYNKKLQLLQELKQSILHKAFNGEL